MGRFSKLDGTGKAPRVEQDDYFKHLNRTWNTVGCHALNAAPGVGKSYIGRAINIAVPDSAIVTPSNQLVDQYCETYPELVAVKGRDHYDTEDEYKRSRKQAQTRPAVFNPLSFHFHYIKGDKPSTVIIDEAHTLAQMLVFTVTQAFNCNLYGIKEDMNDAEVLAWLAERLDKLAKVQHVPKFETRYNRLKLLSDYVNQNLANIQITYQMISLPKTKQKVKHLCINPLRFPKELLHTVFGDARLILMSGTLYPQHLKELGISEYDYKVYNSAAPVENRTIQAIPLKDRNDLDSICSAIVQIRKQAGNPNTLIHVPYALQREYKRRLGPKVITHTKETKDMALERFKKSGGVLLGSGMAEGIDLPGDLCRLIIIPKLLYPNLGDDAVKKRLAMPDGQSWYNLQTGVTTIQQIYRGVRGKNDACNIVVLDSTFPRLIGKLKGVVPEDFIKSIKWSKT